MNTVNNEQSMNSWLILTQINKYSTECLPHGSFMLVNTFETKQETTIV